jgi:DNA-directed RNA polymerase specialized sigma24 family protein
MTNKDTSFWRRFRPIVGERNDQELERLLSLVNNLQPEQRDLIERIYYAKTSFSALEIALGMDRRTIAKRVESIHRALRRGMLCGC